MLKDLFKKTKYITVPLAKRVKNEVESEIPADLFMKCPKCEKTMFREDYESALKVCPSCGHHGRMGAYERIYSMADPGTFSEMFKGLVTENPLSFADYPEKIASLKLKTGLDEAVVTGLARINGMKCLVAAMDSNFLMASMGSVVGEKLTRMFEYGAENRLPAVVFTASGGARMHEGIFSLMQMAKVSAAVGRHSEAGQLYVVVLTDPTTGGVTASFAMLGDVILAEPGALVGFAGRRVIEGTIGHKLPDDFQSAEFQHKHGFVDAIVPRGELKATLARLLRFHGREGCC